MSYSKKEILLLPPLFLAVIMLAFIPHAAHAQAIDYTALELLFGEPVTTSATGAPKRAADVPSAMDILTADDIRRSGSRDLPEIIRRVAGVDVERGSSTASDVGMRGYNQPTNPRLLVLLNGRQVYLGFYEFTSWENIPVNIDEIRQIEVIKGPNAALFGFNAVSGVVNIITYSPLYDDTNTASVTIGNHNQHEADATVTAKTGDWGGIRLSTGGYGRDESKGPLTIGVDSSVNPSKRYAALDSLFQLDSQTQAGFEGTFSKTNATTPIVTYELDPLEVSSGSLKGTLARQTSCGLLKGTAYTNIVRADLHSDLTPGVLFDTATFVNQFELLSTIGINHQTRLSAEYRHESMDLFAQQQLDTKNSFGYDVYSGSGMWDWKMRDDLSWINAVRFDYLVMATNSRLDPLEQFPASAYERDIAETSFNSGLVWKPTDDDTLRATVARGIKIPSLTEFGIIYNQQTPSGIASLTGNPGLEPSVIMNYELGYDRQLRAIDSVAHGSLFFQTTNDVHSLIAPFDIVSVSPVITRDIAANIGDSQSYGLELGIEGERDDYRWNASYSYALVHDHFKVDNDPIMYPIAYEDQRPSHQIRLQLGKTWDKIETDLFGSWVSHSAMIEQSAFGTSTHDTLHFHDTYSLSGRIGYDINDHLTAAVSGTQLNTRSQATTTFLDEQRQVMFTLTGKF